MTGPEDHTSGAPVEASEDEHAFLRLLGWPPPGLARIQGDLWLVTRQLWVAGAVLVLPLAFVISVPQRSMGLGPLGGAWWLTLVTTLVGLVLFADAAVALLRMLSRARRAIGDGYSAHVVGLVLSDRGRDGGFLFQGAQYYSTMPDSERRALSWLRVVGPTLYLAAALWLIVGFSVLVLLAARGFSSPGGLALSTLIPTVLISALGLVVRATDGTLLRRARKAWFKQPWSEELARKDVAEWREAAAQRGLTATSTAGAFPARILGLSFGVFLFFAVVTVVPPVTLVPVSSVGAVLGSVAGPRYSRTLRRAAEAEAYRSFRLPPDSSLTPSEAGEILHALTGVGRDRPVPIGLREPVRVYEGDWIPESPIDDWRTDIPPFWTDTIWAHARAGLSATETTFLQQIEAHPARADFRRVARAAGMDVVAARHEVPFADDATMWSLTLPRFSPLRYGAYSHLGVAALRSAEGRHEEAEEAAREVISFGFLMLEESPTLIGNLIGAVLIGIGGDGLTQVLRASGQTGRAEELEEAIAATDRAISRMSPAGVGRSSTYEYLERLPDVAGNPESPRGLRWEQLNVVATLSPCLNLRRVVFGPGDEYAVWLDEMRQSLVRYPGEAALFEVASRGFAVDLAPNWLTRILSVAMSGVELRGSCAQLVNGLPYFM